MVGLTIQFNHFGLGANTLGSKEIYPAHKKILDQSLRTIFQENASAYLGKRGLFQIKFEKSKPTFYFDGKRVEMKKSSELKRVERILRYYQHTGSLPSLEAAPEGDSLRTLMTGKVVRQINQASIPGANGNILAGMRVADDTLSVVRNFMLSLPHIHRDDPIVSHLGYYSGIFWSFFAFRELDDGFLEFKRAKLIGDSEGERRAEARLFSGAIVSIGATTYLTGKILNSFSFSRAAAPLLSVSNAFFGAGSLLAMGFSALGVVRCQRFNERLNEYLENPALSGSQKMEGALRFLLDSMRVTKEEKAALFQEIEEKHPDWSVAQKEDLLQQKLGDLTEVKVKYMKRRTSNRSLQLILNHAEKILEKLADPIKRAEGIKEASTLINRVQKESQIKRNIYLLGLIAAAISFVAAILLTVATGGALPLILYGVAGAIYLGITVYTLSGLLLKNEKDAKLITLHPLQNLSHLI